MRLEANRNAGGERDPGSPARAMGRGLATVPARKYVPSAMIPAGRYRGRALAILAVMMMTSVFAARGAAADEPIGPPVEISVAYTGDLIRNTTGGVAVGGTYLDNVDLTLSIDGERVFGIPGLRLLVHGLHNNEAQFSERYSGDAMTASNIDAPRATRLYEAWLDYTFDSRRLGSLRLGLYDLNSEFDTNDSRALFVNSSFGVGHDLGQSGFNGPSIFPVTSLALRLALAPRDDWLLLTAVLDGVPGDPDDPSATTIRLAPDDGALLIAELQRTGPSGTNVAAGAWRYTKDGPRIDDELLGAIPVRTTGRAGVYTNVDFEIWRESASSQRSVRAFARAGYASGTAHEYDLNVQAGLVRQQPWSRNDEERVGIAMSYARAGSPYRDARSTLGSPLHAGEFAVELTYRRALTSWLTLQPTLQYIEHPSAERERRDAVVVGLRFELHGAWP